MSELSPHTSEDVDETVISKEKEPQLTLRAVLTGALIGGALSLCNVYMGLKIGWSLNMSVTAALLSYGGYHLLGQSRARRGHPHTSWGLLENNINQTSASAAASISSAGLVAPIPAWSLLTGQQLSVTGLMLWIGFVALLGVLIAVGLRRQLLIQEQLAFPYGVATAETMREIYARGSEAMARVIMLGRAALIGGSAKLSIHLTGLKYLSIPGGLGPLSWTQLTFTVSTSPLFIAVGVLVGTRAGLSMLLGALIAWAGLAPLLVEWGWVRGSQGAGMWFKELVTWLLWPGVALMVSSALCSSALSMGNSRGGKMSQRELKGLVSKEEANRATTEEELHPYILVSLLALVILISVSLQWLFFGIEWWMALIGVGMTLVLAIVAARVSGETGLTPIGAMGKVTQLSFGLIAPGQVSTNLMAANVTGGAASQCADLLHDLKTGLLIGASPKQQTYAQLAGVASGAIFGALAYKLLVGDLDQLQRLWDDPEWAMPAVVQWRAVAELFRGGIDQLPHGTLVSMIWGGAIGCALSIGERMAPSTLAKWLPSPTAMGLAFVIPAYYSVSIALGALFACALRRWSSTWAKRFMIVFASGMIAGDSLTGVAIALSDLLGSW